MFAAITRARSPFHYFTRNNEDSSRFNDIFRLPGDSASSPRQSRFYQRAPPKQPVNKLFKREKMAYSII